MNKTIESYQTQWYKADEDKWINSWSWVAPMTLGIAQEYLKRDQAYFYKRIPLRIVKITTEIVYQAAGLQED